VYQWLIAAQWIELPHDRDYLHAGDFGRAVLAFAVCDRAINI
jgi:hypothetical protein